MTNTGRVRKLRSLGGWATLVLLPSLMGACTGDADPKPKTGGQSGLEGGCDPESDQAVPAVGSTVLNFSRAAAVALAEGSHTTSVRWVEWAGVEDASLTLELEMDEQDGLAHAGCGTYLEQPAQLTLRSSDGGLDAEVGATLIAYDAERALVQAEIPRSELEGWNERLASYLVLSETDGYPVRFEITAQGVAGDLMIQGRDGAATCELAAWPAARHCPAGAVELAVGELVRGFDPLELIAEANALGTVPLTWDQGATTELTSTLELSADWFCVNEHVTDESGLPVDDVVVELPARAHLVTADGKLDAWMTASLSATVGPSGEASSFAVHATTLVSPDSNVVGDIRLPQAAQLGLQMFDDGGTLNIREVSVRSQDLVNEELNEACLNSDFLGETQVVMSASW